MVYFSFQATLVSAGFGHKETSDSMKITIDKMLTLEKTNFEMTIKIFQNKLKLNDLELNDADDFEIRN